SGYRRAILRKHENTTRAVVKIRTSRAAFYEISIKGQPRSGQTHHNIARSRLGFYIVEVVSSLSVAQAPQGQREYINISPIYFRPGKQSLDCLLSVCAVDPCILKP
ncbi:hypothetical protein MCOR29_009170, partial [Pyricularia oryzae]